MTEPELTRQAIRLAQRQAKRLGRQLTRDEVLHLRVQRTSLGVRLGVAGFGVCGCSIGILIHSKGAPLVASLAFGAAGLVLIIAGAFGRRVALEKEMSKLSADYPQRIIDSIVNAIL